MSVTTTRRPLTWHAGADRLAHAFRVRDTRTLCGLPIVPERLAWPTGNVCPDCRDRAD